MRVGAALRSPDLASNGAGGTILDQNYASTHRSDYTPKVAVSNLVNSLKGVSSRLPRTGSGVKPSRACEGVAVSEVQPVVSNFRR